VASRALVDTSALLAVAHPRDQYHARARAIGRRHVAGGGRFVGSMLVLAELQGHLLFRRGPVVARRVLAALLGDPAYEWVDVTGDLVRAAAESWLERFGDQRFTLADAVNFELMRRLKLRTAFAFDDDFVTAGFETLR
jgi:predicted nucleic acid-binding protein